MHLVPALLLAIIGASTVGSAPMAGIPLLALATVIAMYELREYLWALREIGRMSPSLSRRERLWRAARLSGKLSGTGGSSYGSGPSCGGGADRIAGVGVDRAAEAVAAAVVAEEGAVVVDDRATRNARECRGEGRLCQRNGCSR
ncbi:hypothetical protein AB0I35_20335 [Nocardia sp. NPDC050378]|uniref:hypothetical protein n=1 Tax=Nocardia sp. NPDC050378 TaxID=3155400 RepID=UPI0033C6508D